MSLIPTIRNIWPGNAAPDANSVQHVDLHEIRPTLRHIPAARLPAVPPRPAAEPVVPQTLAQAEATLQALQAASKIVADRMAAQPDLVCGEECFSSTRAKAIRTRRAEDVQTALREAAAGAPLSILACGDMWRMHVALECADAYREQPGAVQIQGRIVANLQEQQVVDEYNAALPKLEKMDAEVVKLLLKARDVWNARILAAQAIRRPPCCFPHPQLRMIGDNVARLMKILQNIKPEDVL